MILIYMQEEKFGINMNIADMNELNSVLEPYYSKL